MPKFEVKPVVFSSQYVLDTDHIYQYGLETFGEVQAQKYEELIDKIASDLTLSYWMYPECRHLPTKNHIYRNIILESHLIIYRIKTDKIEVLRVIHSHSSIKRIRTVSRIKM
jgi:toxin ParE1/3/4